LLWSLELGIWSFSPTLRMSPPAMIPSGILARPTAPAHNQDAMDYLEKARRVLDIEIFEVQRLRERLDENFSRAVTLIKDCLEARGRVVVVGVGKSGHIGRKIASTLTSTG